MIMERTAKPSHRLHATSLAIVLLLATVAPAASAAPSRGGDAVPTSRARNTPVTLNFVNADIEAVSRAIGAMLNRDVLVDPRVKGTITVYNDKPQPLEQAYRNYLSALRGLGFTVVESGGFLKVVPEADAKLQTGVVSVGQPSRAGDQVLTQIFKLNYENPNNLVAVLRPLITANNTINASPANNSLVITDYADNLQRLGRIIAALDQPSGSDLEVVPLKNAIASDMVQTVQKLVDGAAGAVPGVQAQVGGATSIMADPRTNSLIIRASNAGRMAQARMIVDKLDMPVAGGGPAGNIWVVYLKNADATKLAEVLRAAIAAGSIGGSNGGGGGGVSSSGLGNAGGRESSGTPSLPNTSGNSSMSGANASPQSTNPVAQSARPSTGGMVQADPATNSLIITASEPLYRQMRQVIDQLDVRRAQVYVEALMVSIDEQRAAQFGFQWQNLFGKKGDSTITGAGTNFGGGLNNIANASAALTGGTAGLAQAFATAVSSGSGTVSNGLNIGILKQFGKYYTLGALAQFLEANTGANVLSTPTLVALDNEEAKIVVGQNIPLVTGSYTSNGTSSSSGTVTPFQTVERQDVGITLRIRSSVGENGSVRMTIYEENSSVAPNTGGQTTNKTSLESYVTVDDGSLLVLGGLISDEYGDEDDQVPGLGNIPIIGNLFKSQSRTRHKRDLILFLRPVVIRSQSDADALTVNRYDAIRAVQQQTQPASSIVMRVNEAPVIPPLKSDTRQDPAAPQASGTGTLPMPDMPPVPVLGHAPAPAPPAPQPGAAAAPAPAASGATTTTTTTTTTFVPLPAAPASGASK